jgi:tRNA-2-methylthio-N6-dimethylallyladenosine synthase
VTKKLFIKTYGCPMNVYDSARMVDLMDVSGYALTERPDDADLIVLNTCHIRDKAAEKVYSELGRLRAVKARRAEQGEGTVIAVAGCVAQAEGAEILARAPYVDLVLGPQAFPRLPKLLAAFSAAQHGIVDTEFPAEPKFDSLPPVGGQGVSAGLAVQEGCDRFCTFCVVPYTRGAEYSRPVDAIIDEASRLIDAGAKEITLLGQNVNAYHGTAPGDAAEGEWGLGRLIRRLARVDGLQRLRYLTSHPRDVDESLIDAHGEVDLLMPYLHLPLQAGSDTVLEAMNRGHTADEYRRTVARLRAVRPDLALSSDFIVGFPGETEADFQATLDMVTEIGFAQAYSFCFSPRPGTPAAALEQAVPEAIKAERLGRLQAALELSRMDFNRASAGRTVAVLLDRRGRHPGQLAGRSPHYQAVHVEAPDSLLGEIVELWIAGAGAHGLAGELAPPALDSADAGERRGKRADA